MAIVLVVVMIVVVVRDLRTRIPVTGRKNRSRLKVLHRCKQTAERRKEQNEERSREGGWLGGGARKRQRGLERERGRERMGIVGALPRGGH